MTGFDVKLLVQTGDSPQINFGYGGHQEARGWSVTPQSSFYVENVLEELDSEGEWFFEEDKFLLYVCGWHPHDSRHHSSRLVVLFAVSTSMEPDVSVGQTRTPPRGRASTASTSPFRCSTPSSPSPPTAPRRRLTECTTFRSSASSSRRYNSRLSDTF